MAQRFGWLWLPVPALLLLPAALSPLPARAGEAAGGKATPARTKAAPTATLVGTVVTVVPESRTLVVDVRLGADILRVGAAVTPKTSIQARGGPAGFDALEPGCRVRLTFRRVETGNEAIAVEIVRGPRR